MENMDKELRCPHCSYIRQPKTDKYGPKECPRCGIIYEKYEAYLKREQTKTQVGQQLQKNHMKIIITR